MVMDRSHADLATRRVLVVAGAIIDQQGVALSLGDGGEGPAFLIRQLLDVGHNASVNVE
jgi:type II secretory pathway predicted ATPase ExeA